MVLCVVIDCCSTSAVPSVLCRVSEFILVDEDVEEGARDLMELNDEGANSISRKRGRRKSMFLCLMLHEYL